LLYDFQSSFSLSSANISCECVCKRNTIYVVNFNKLPVFLLGSFSCFYTAVKEIYLYKYCQSQSQLSLLAAAIFFDHTIISFPCLIMTSLPSIDLVFFTENALVTARSIT
jgi:hypothetical protein